MHWMNVEVLTVFGVFATNAMTPHTENYSISVKRKVVVHTMVSVEYAGIQAHPAACLTLSTPSNVAAGSVTCWLFGEKRTYTKANSRVMQRMPHLDQPRT